MVRPLFLLDGGVEMVVPPLAALLADAAYLRRAPTWEMFSNEGPLLRPVFFDEFDQEDVLILGPGLFLPCLTIIYTFDRIRVIGVDLLPAGDAIDVFAPWKIAGDVLPVHFL